MIKTVILDFDGTIADTCGLIVRTIQSTLEQVGLPQKTYEECAATIGLPLRLSFVKLMPMDDDTASRCEATYREIFMRNNAEYNVSMFPHVKETIYALHNEKLDIAIASSRSRQSLMTFLHDMELEECIRCVVSANDVRHSKPAPDMALKILSETGCKCNEAMMVGDTKYDIDMGSSAGVLTCAVSYGNGRPEDLALADYQIDDFSQLPEIIRRINAIPALASHDKRC